MQNILVQSMIDNGMRVPSMCNLRECDILIDRIDLEAIISMQIRSFDLDMCKIDYSSIDIVQKSAFQQFALYKSINMSIFQYWKQTIIFEKLGSLELKNEHIEFFRSKKYYCCNTKCKRHLEFEIADNESAVCNSCNIIKFCSKDCLIATGHSSKECCKMISSDIFNKII